MFEKLDILHDAKLDDMPDYMKNRIMNIFQLLEASLRGQKKNTICTVRRTEKTSAATILDHNKIVLPQNNRKSSLNFYSVDLLCCKLKANKRVN